jgi:hypothetical protein
LFADAVGAICRALMEYRSGGLHIETKQMVGELIARLFAIWGDSRFGSFDAELRAIKRQECRPRWL